MSESKRHPTSNDDAPPYGIIRSDAGAEWERLWREVATRGRARLDARQRRKQGRLRRTLNALLRRLTGRPASEAPASRSEAPPVAPDDPEDENDEDWTDAEAHTLPLRLMCQPGAVVVARAGLGTTGHLVVLDHSALTSGRWVGAPMCALASGHGRSANRGVWEPMAPLLVRKLARCAECLHHAQRRATCQGRPCAFLSTTLLRDDKDAQA